MASAAHAFHKVGHRLFFAVRPPAAVREKIDHDRAALGIKGRVVARDKFHMTLVISEDYDDFQEELAAAAIAAANDVSARSFRTALDTVQLNGQIAVLLPSERPQALIAFREQLGFVMLRAGFDLRANYRFDPHLTLGYNVAEHRSEQIDAISWKVEDFVLIHSKAGLGEHVELGRWKLLD